MTDLKVEIRITEEASEPCVIIYANEMTEEIAQIAAAVKNASGRVLAVREEDRIIVLRPEEIYMARVENEKISVYGKAKVYSCLGRLYKIEELMGSGFLRISKSTIINLKYLDSVEPSFNGMMLVKLKNGSKDYVSRKYLPALKKYLGL